MKNNFEDVIKYKVLKNMFFLVIELWINYKF